MRLVIAFALDEPWSVIARLIAYGVHARELGIDVTVKTLTPRGVDRVVDLAAFTPTLDAPTMDLSELVPGRDDVVMFSAPKVHHTVSAQYGRRRPRFVHILQSGLAASVVDDVGYGYRLFQKPMTRVVVAREIRDTIVRLVGETSDMLLIEANVETAPFARRPMAADPFTVVLNAFDGTFCGRVIDLARQRGFSEPVRVVSGAMSVRERAAAYRASTVLLAAPTFGEGLSQPIHEAVAAGCALIMTHCEALATLPPGVEPFAVVRQGDIEGMARALAQLDELPAARLTGLRRASQAHAVAGAASDERELAKAMLARIFGLEAPVL